MCQEQSRAREEFVIQREPLEPIRDVLRTPDRCFGGIEAMFPFQPRYFKSRVHGAIRIHYIDEGPKQASQTILLMHGEPTWSFIYRNMIPRLVDRGFRVVAPDLVGFGRSDKPAMRSDYSYERQVDWMTELMIGIELSNATCFLQDWGGLIGLRIVARLPERFERVVISNTGLPMGGGRATKDFQVWASSISQESPTWSSIIQAGSNKHMDQASLRAYDVPFPSEDYKPATRVYPQLVPQFDGHMSVEENKGALKRVFSQWTRPFLTLFSNNDPVSRGGERFWKELVPGAKLPGIPHQILNGGHFVQEDAPDQIVQIMLKFIHDFPVDLKHHTLSTRAKL